MHSLGMHRPHSTWSLMLHQTAVSRCKQIHQTFAKTFQEGNSLKRQPPCLAEALGQFQSCRSLFCGSIGTSLTSGNLNGASLVKKQSSKSTSTVISRANQIHLEAVTFWPGPGNLGLVLLVFTGRRKGNLRTLQITRFCE